MNWLIEEFNRDNSFLDIKEEAVKQGHNVEIVEGVSIVYEDETYKKFPKGSCTVFLGSISAARKLQRNSKLHGWVPNLWCNWNNYKCSTYYAYWGEHLFNQDYTFIPVAEFARKLDSFFDLTDRIFVRPDSGAKPFTGAIFEKRDFEGKSWDYLMSELNPYDLLVVSSIKPIEREWRVVCSGKEVITGSRYKTHGQVDYRGELPEDVLQFAENVIKTDWQPDPIYVLDICRSRNKLYLLEIGSFNVAGLYHCDFSKIVKTVVELAQKEHNEYYEVENGHMA